MLIAANGSLASYTFVYFVCRSTNPPGGLRDGPDAGTSARYLYLARSVFAVPAALMHALLCGIPYFNILLPLLRPPRPGEAANHHATWTLGCSIWHERGLEY